MISHHDQPIRINQQGWFFTVLQWMCPCHAGPGTARDPPRCQCLLPGPQTVSSVSLRHPVLGGRTLPETSQDTWLKLGGTS